MTLYSSIVQTYYPERMTSNGTSALSSRSLEHGQGEAERSALAWRAGHRDPPAVQLHQHARDDESQPCAAARVGRAIVGPEELGKQVRLLFGREADAGITNVDAHEAILSPRGHRDAALHR